MASRGYQVQLGLYVWARWPRLVGLTEGPRPILGEMIERLTGIQALSFHSDMSIKNGERITVFTLAEDLEARFA
jgi:hypothetical protein